MHVIKIVIHFQIIPKKPPRQKKSPAPIRRAEPSGEGTVPAHCTPPISPPHNLATVVEASKPIPSDSAHSNSSTQNASQHSTDQSCEGKTGCEVIDSPDLKSGQSEAPEKSPKPELPPRSVSLKVDNSVDPVTGRQVYQSFYLEMSTPKPKDSAKPVSEVKPQVSKRTLELAQPCVDRVDNYGILFPNLKKEALEKPKKCELTRSNTSPEDGGYVGLDPVSPTAKFKEKQGLLRRTNTAPEESVYTPMNNPEATTNVNEESLKENEYSEIPEKSPKDLSSPTPLQENVYATISETKRVSGDSIYSHAVSDTTGVDAAEDLERKGSD